MNRTRRLPQDEPASPRYRRPGAAERLAVNTGTLAVVAACTALAVVVLAAGKLLPIERL